VFYFRWSHFGTITNTIKNEIKLKFPLANQKKKRNPFALSGMTEKICINFKFQFAVEEKIKKNYANQEKNRRHLQEAKNAETKLADNKETLYRFFMFFIPIFFAMLTSQAKDEGHPFSGGS